MYLFVKLNLILVIIIILEVVYGTAPFNLLFN